MSKEIYISSTPHETRLAIVESDELTEIYYERENEYTLAGSIYNGKVTRVLPGMQSSFVDIGLERDAFLYITDFMEEAADTAEFDHSGDAPRPARQEGQRGSRGEQSGNGREQSRNGNDRSGGYVSERNQEQANATPSSDVARASEGRGEEFGGRNDRGGRGRGRGRRDRGGNSDRVGQVDRSASADAGFSQPASGMEQGQSNFEADERSFVPVSHNEGQEPSTVEAVELGEGAPGADGSRRWRGRRGRRRGRGTGQGGPETATESTSAAAPGGDGDGLGGEEFEERSSFEVDGSAVEVTPVAHTVTPLQPREAIQPVQPVGRDRQRERGGGNDRGDRGRNDRGDRNGRAPRAPRGFAPTRSLYGVDSSPEAEEIPYGQTVDSIAASGSESEPLILPGESLSKYRKGGEDVPSVPLAASSFATQAALPDTGFKVDAGWDGGAMLPGETLSRYRGGSSQASGAQQRSNEGSDGGRRDGRRDERGGRNDRSRDGRRDGREASSSVRAAVAPMMVPSSIPAPDLQSVGPVSGYAHVDHRSEEIQGHQPDFSHSELPQATAEAPTMEDRGLAHQAGNELHGSIEQIDAAQSSAQPNEQGTEQGAELDYEPEGESVSYRVDPSAPSEYRQSPPVAVEETRTVDGEVAGELSAVPSAEGSTSFESDSHDVSDARGLHDAGDSRAEAASTTFDEEAITAHEITSVHSSGEMESDFASLHEPVLEEAAAQGFAPGAGDLEEDFIEEEEFEIPSLHARGEEEFDDLEEEQLEGAADLGMMIRDMSLDHITRTEGSIEEDEDDFEEDTIEEDIDSEEVSEEQGAHENFVEPYDVGSREEGGGEGESSRASSSFRSGSGEGVPSTNGGDRNGRRDSGRRGGRERSGNRDNGNRSGRSDRFAAPESNGYGDRQASSDRGGYSDRSGLGERARNTGGASDRDRGRSSGRGGRQSMQMTNLPAISDLLKPGQEILCQIAKEPIAKKGARITSHIALPGRFLVFMPTVSHTGVSRKIESDGERRRLKEILLSEKGEAAGGFIVRTAAAGASEEELRSDLRFLLNLWTDIKQRSESSKSPALIYHDLNLVERILRDQVTDSFSAIWVDTETEYERVLRFLQRFQPGLIRRVKLYTKETPLFEQFGITEEINKALRSKVWLKSGGSIVINQTEALVAIDINTGKYVGKTARLEDTIVKTNLDAIPEIVRQIRLRDLGGIIIIDFIDMDERKNRNRVMQALEDELKTDRAPSKVLPFNDFGLVAITRKRVKQSLERTLSTTCNVCMGTGMVKSPVTVCNDIYVEMRKMHKHLDRGDVMLRVNPEVVKQLKSTGTRWLQEMEEMCGKTILIKSDPSLHPEQFDIH